MERSGGSQPTSGRGPAALLVLTACALVLAGCGSSMKPANPAASAHSAALRFSECMRAHGVTNFPDPGSGGGIQIHPGSGLNPRSPAFQSAQQDCSKLLPGGGPFGGRLDPNSRSLMLRLAMCMRAHGLTTFPDPTTSRPSLTGNGPAGLVLGRGGYFLSLPPGVNPTSPAFQHAAVACGFPIPPHTRP
jgi:hypothetical protein